MGLFKKKIDVKRIKMFNDVINNNSFLQYELLELSKNFKKLTEKEYRDKLLVLFKKVDFKVSSKEIDYLFETRLKLEQESKNINLKEK